MTTPRMENFKNANFLERLTQENVNEYIDSFNKVNKKTDILQKVKMRCIRYITSENNCDNGFNIQKMNDMSIDQLFGAIAYSNDNGNLEDDFYDEICEQTFEDVEENGDENENDEDIFFNDEDEKEDGSKGVFEFDVDIDENEEINKNEENNDEDDLWAEEETILKSVPEQQQEEVDETRKVYLDALKIKNIMNYKKKKGKKYISKTKNFEEELRNKETIKQRMFNAITTFVEPQNTKQREYEITEGASIMFEGYIKKPFVISKIREDTEVVYPQKFLDIKKEKKINSKLLERVIEKETDVVYIDKKALQNIENNKQNIDIIFDLLNNVYSKNLYNETFFKNIVKYLRDGIKKQSNRKLFNIVYKTFVSLFPLYINECYIFQEVLKNGLVDVPTYLYYMFAEEDDDFDNFDIYKKININIDTIFYLFPEIKEDYKQDFIDYIDVNALQYTYNILAPFFKDDSKTFIVPPIDSDAINVDIDRFIDRQVSLIEYLTENIEIFNKSNSTIESVIRKLKQEIINRTTKNMDDKIDDKSVIKTEKILADEYNLKCNDAEVDRLFDKMNTFVDNILSKPLKTDVFVDKESIKEQIVSFDDAMKDYFIMQLKTNDIIEKDAKSLKLNSLSSAQLEIVNKIIKEIYAKREQIINTYEKLLNNFVEYDMVDYLNDKKDCDSLSDNYSKIKKYTKKQLAQYISDINVSKEKLLKYREKLREINDKLMKQREEGKREIGEINAKNQKKINKIQEKIKNFENNSKIDIHKILTYELITKSKNVDELCELLNDVKKSIKKLNVFIMLLEVAISENEKYRDNDKTRKKLIKHISIYTFLFLRKLNRDVYNKLFDSTQSFTEFLNEYYNKSAKEMVQYVQEYVYNNNDYVKMRNARYEIVFRLFNQKNDDMKSKSLKSFRLNKIEDLKTRSLQDIERFENLLKSEKFIEKDEQKDEEEELEDIIFDDDEEELEEIEFEEDEDEDEKEKESKKKDDINNIEIDEFEFEF